MATASGAGAQTAPRLPPQRPPDLGGRTDGIVPEAPKVPEKPKPAEAPAGPEAAQPVEAAASCLGELNAVTGNRLRAVSPERLPRDPACQVEDPVQVETLAVRSKTGFVTLEPAPVLSCAMARAVSKWVDLSVQPLTRGAFDADLAALKVGGGQECRRRNQAATGPLSEHANGKALDIFAFQFVSGTGQKSSVSVENPDGEAQARFLAAIRQSACGAFTTSLGPGSDAAHASHLHVDIEDRRSRASRFCQ